MGRGVSTGTRIVDRGPIPDGTLLQIAQQLAQFVDPGWNGEISFRFRNGTWVDTQFPACVRRAKDLQRNAHRDAVRRHGGGGDGK